MVHIVEVVGLAIGLGWLARTGLMNKKRGIP
jgi:hypothetical protein